MIELIGLSIGVGASMFNTYILENKEVKPKEEKKREDDKRSTGENK